MVHPSLSDILVRIGLTAADIITDATAVTGSPPKAIFIGGSHADGCSNERSDVDIYLLVDAAPVSRAGYEVSVLHGNCLQYDLVTAQMLDKAIASLELSRDFEDVAMSLGTNQLLHRLSRGLVVIGQEIVEAYKVRLRASNYKGFSSYVKQELSENALQDAYGAWAAGQVETAIYNVRLAAHRALESVLSLCGQTATNEKWVFEKLFQSAGRNSALAKHFLRLYAAIPTTFDRATAEPHFEHCLRFVQRMLDVSAIETICPSKHEALSRLSSRLLQRVSSQDDAQRNSKIHLRRKSGKNIIYSEAMPRSELSDRAALVWAALAVTPTVRDAVDEAASAAPQFFAQTDTEALAEKLARSWATSRMTL